MMKRRTSDIIRLLAAAIVLPFTLSTAHAAVGGQKDVHLDVQRYFEIIGEAIATLQTQYVDTIN